MNDACPHCGTPAAVPAVRHCHVCGARLVGGPHAPGGEHPSSASHPSGLPSEVRNWAMAAHASALVGAWVLLAFLGPLVVWLAKREAHPFIDVHGREALNFNLSVLLYTVVAVGLAFLLIGIPLLIAIGAGWLVLTIVATVRAANGEHYRYPFTIRFVS